MEYANLTGFVDADGNIITHPCFKYFTLSSKGNVQIASDAGKKLNIEAGDNEAHKPAGKIQLDTSHYADPSDMDEFKVSVICDKGSKVEGLKLECAGIKFVTADADAEKGWDSSTFKQFYKKTTGSVDTWAKVNMHGASFDLRARATGAGTGGGIAMQIASCDSHFKENKFKIESDRKVPIERGMPGGYGEWGEYYSGEGGKGMEIFTMNSQFMSAWSKTYRFRADSPVYAVTRGSLQDVDGKVDYPTQEDDSKDIIADSEPITWGDIVSAVKYLKSQGKI